MQRSGSSSTPASLDDFIGGIFPEGQPEAAHQVETLPRMSLNRVHVQALISHEGSASISEKVKPPNLAKQCLFTMFDDFIYDICP